MKIQELSDIVDELNDSIYKHYEDSLNCFSFGSNGYVSYISFNDKVLWDSENDERNYIEDEKVNDYEPLINYVKRQYNKYVDELMLYYFIN